MTIESDPRALVRAAGLLQRAGRLEEAVLAYERLLTRWPNLPDSWYNLAVLQRNVGRFEAALASYQQALDRGVSRPEEVHLNRGVIYSDGLRRDDAAEAELRAALRLNPAYVPALLNLANLQSDRGLRDEARMTYERILEQDSGCPEALARYAEVKPLSGPDDPLIGQLKQGLRHPGATPADRASLGFALGRALDACGVYDQAFEAYVAANRSSREGAGMGARLYDRHQQEHLVDRLIEVFATDPPGVTTHPSNVRPIFICGMFRSGSTLAEQVLAGHSRVATGGEIDILPSLVRTELAPFPDRIVDMAPSRFSELGARYLETLSKLFPGAPIVTDKRPDNFLYIGLIKRLFPDARIVHTTRNPLDNCLSVFFLHLDHRMGYALDLGDTAHYYRQYRRLMAHWKSRYGADILDFDYDTFVHEPRPAVARLLDFCGLDWEERCMAFHQVRNAVKTASVWQVREPLYQRSSGRWRHYARHLGPLEADLQDLPA